MERALIAYSGGVDSTLVAKIAYDVLGDRAMAVTAVSPSLLPEELEDARIQVAVMGFLIRSRRMKWTTPITQRTRLTDAISVALHDTLKPLATVGYPYVVDGVNADDLRDYRPGIQAAKERGAITLSKWVLLKPKYANSRNIWVCLGGINRRNLA